MRSSTSLYPTSSLVGGALRNDAVLYFTVLSARDLKTVQKIGVQDPYCAIHLVTGGREASEPAFKSSTHENAGGDRRVTLHAMDSEES